MYEHVWTGHEVSGDKNAGVAALRAPISLFISYISAGRTAMESAWSARVY